MEANRERTKFADEIKTFRVMLFNGSAKLELSAKNYTRTL